MRRRSARAEEIVGAISKGQDATGGYHRALEECARVAREEFSVANRSLDDAERLARRLQTAVAAVARRAPADGAAVEDARARLQELEAKLEATLSNSLHTASAGLRAKEAVLNRFTVTLFGRTMAGKSTIREALTRGDGATIGKGAQRTTRDVREYTWNALRIIDTPGIGAYEGEEDRGCSAVLSGAVQRDSSSRDRAAARVALDALNRPLADATAAPVAAVLDLGDGRYRERRRTFPSPHRSVSGKGTQLAITAPTQAAAPCA